MEFSDLALAKFLQSAPELGNLIITFKDVTSEMSEETNTSVGIFVLKSGGDYFFVPVISKADNVYPIDSIFFNSKEKFFPLTKKTTEVVLNSQKMGLGKTTKIPDSVIVNPSVYDLINPPRTGKFMYASKSRLTDFLGILPNELKTFVREKIAEDKTIYSGVNHLFGLNEVFTALQPATEIIKQAAIPNVQVVTDGQNLSPEQIEAIADKGYFIKSASSSSSDYLPRIAIKGEDFDKMGKLYAIDGASERNRDWTVVFQTGQAKQVWVPARQTTRVLSKDGKRNLIGILDNGDYLLADSAIASGEPKSGNTVLKSLCAFSPPIMLKNIDSGDTFATFNPNMELIGIYRCNGTPVMHEYGITLRVVDLITQQAILLHGYRNMDTVVWSRDINCIVPFTVAVIRLQSNLSHDLEKNINSAQKKRWYGEMSILGDSMEILHDGVDFSMNGKRIGHEIKVAQLLVDEGLEPDVIESFIKEAKEKKRLKIYISKKAAFEPGQIPQFGNQPPKQQDSFGAGKNNLDMNRTGGVKDSLGSNDGQIVESSIISELLQSPDLYEYISEYLPDIEEAIDKLGRVLFLSRIHINKLSEKNDPDGIFSFLERLKNVYRTLGDTYIKLQQLTTNVPASNQ